MISEQTGYNENLFEAAKRGDLDEVNCLLASGAEVNAKQYNGTTALMEASVNGHKEVVLALLNMGADVNAKAKDGYTALMVASLNGHKEIVQALLDKGASEITDTANPVAYFFTTSTYKLILMSIFTLGFYDIYWFYKNWVLIKERNGLYIMPFWRALFAPIWAYSCFEHIRKAALMNNIKISLPIGFLAIALFIFNLLWRLPEPYWYISWFFFLPIIPVNNLALKLNKQLVPGFQNNEKITGWNWVGLIFGGLVILLDIVNTLKQFQLVS